MKAILRVVAAALSVAGLAGLKAALAVFAGAFGGAAPADVSPVVFGVLAAGVIALVGYIVGKLGPKA